LLATDQFFKLMLLTYSDAPVYNDTPSLTDNTDETFHYDSSTARVSAIFFPLKALSEKSSRFISPLAHLDVRPA
jgi:hypothetical protein